MCWPISSRLYTVGAGRLSAAYSCTPSQCPEARPSGMTCPVQLAAVRPSISFQSRPFEARHLHPVDSIGQAQNQTPTHAREPFHAYLTTPPTRSRTTRFHSALVAPSENWPCADPAYYCRLWYPKLAPDRLHNHANCRMYCK